MPSSDILPTAALCLLLVLYSTGVSLALNKTSQFPALLAFGDSILDTGNNNYRFTLTRSDFPPYGRDLPLGLPTGRFGNGRIFSDLLAEGLGIKSLLPAYHSLGLVTSGLETGVCFASAGAGLDTVTNLLQNVISSSEQLDDFKQYISDLEGAVGQEKANDIISNSVVLISFGNNDLAITFSFFHLLIQDVQLYTTYLVSLASSFISDLHDLGATKFAFMSTVPVGYLPSARTLAGGPLRIPAFWVSYIAESFNSKLEAEINSLDLPGVKAVYVDVYNPLVDIIENPGQYGFSDSTRGCCGTGLIETGPSCNLFNPFTCWDASTYVFWDCAHPSEKAYQTIMPQVVDTITKALLV